MSSRLSSASTPPKNDNDCDSYDPGRHYDEYCELERQERGYWEYQPDGSRVWVTPPISLVPIGPNPGKPPSPGNSNDGMPGGGFEDLDPVVVEDSRDPRLPTPPRPCLSTPSRQTTAAALAVTAAAAPPPKALRPQAPPSQPPLKPRPPPRQQAARRLRSLAASSAKTAAAAPSSATTGTTPSPTHSSPNTCTTFTARSCAS